MRTDKDIVDILSKYRGLGCTSDSAVVQARDLARARLTGQQGRALQDKCGMTKLSSSSCSSSFLSSKNPSDHDCLSLEHF